MLDQEARRATVIVPFPAEIGITRQERAYDQLYAAFANGAAVVVADFSATRRCDCSSLRHLVTIQHRVAASGAELRLAIPPDGPVHRMAALINLDRQLPVFPNAHAAASGRRFLPLNARSPRTGGKTVTGADIVDLMKASELHILRWQAWLGELRRSAGSPPPGPDLEATWDTVAALIDLHVLSDDEICSPAIYDSTPHGRVLARAAADAHTDISERIGETSLQPPGSPPWWRLVRTTLAAWARQCDEEEHGAPAACRRHADPALRRRLAWQWRAFREARIRDQSYSDAPLQLQTCQLRQGRPATPRLADPSFSPLACTCQDCTGRLARIPRLSHILLPRLAAHQRPAVGAEEALGQEAESPLS